ncbi:hypothetical protein ACMC9I_02140 [Deinococcota bacterium DY0809b]
MKTMYQLTRYIRLVFLALAGFVFVACSTQSGTTVPPNETISLDIKLQVYNSSDASVEKAAVIINDSGGNVLDYRVLDNPSEEEHSMTFSSVPTNGTVTVLSKSTRHLTWPADDNYTTATFVTFEVPMMQNVEGRININPYWGYLRWSNPAIHTQLLSLEASCPQETAYLGSSWLNPENGGWWVGSLPCNDGSANGSLWQAVQQSDGKISAVVWSQKEPLPWREENYTQPLQYVAVTDHDPNDTYSVSNLNAFLSDTTNASLTVSNLPSGANVYYNVTGIRKSAPLTGFQAFSEWGSPTSTVTVADILSNLDAVVQHAQVYKEFTESSTNYVSASYRLYKFSTTSNFSQNTTWDYSSFPTAPNPSGVTLQQPGQLSIKAQGFGRGNKGAIFRVWTITNQPNPTYIRWYAYAEVNPSSSTLEYKFPKLPSALADYAPNLGYGYVSANISARSYELYPDRLVTQGTARHVYVRKRDDISGQSLREFPGPGPDSDDAGMLAIPTKVLP